MHPNLKCLTIIKLIEIFLLQLHIYNSMVHFSMYRVMVNFPRSISIRVKTRKRCSHQHFYLALLCKFRLLQFSKRRNKWFNSQKKGGKIIIVFIIIICFLTWKIQKDQLKNILKKRENSVSCLGTILNIKNSFLVDKQALNTHRKICYLKCNQKYEILKNFEKCAILI